MPSYGYARVSTADQDLDVQIAALKAAGCDIIRSEKKSGTTRKGRTELELLLEFLRPGDTLVVTRIDRLARSVLDLQVIATDLVERQVHLKATEQPIDTSSAAGRAFFGMLSVFAEFETTLRRERQMEGIEAARKKGVYKGRQRTVPTQKIGELYVMHGASVAEIVRETGVSRSSVYRAIGELV